jgi:hypothetical protein
LRPSRDQRAAAAALLVALCALVWGCPNPLANIERIATSGYVAPDLLPGDREVGSWRRGERTRLLGKRDFREALGEAAYSRLRYWDLGKSVGATYTLGRTGRSVRVEIYDLAKARGAFDVYGLIRDDALGTANKLPGPKRPGLAGPGKPRARVTKVGAQGLLFDHSLDYSPERGKFVPAVLSGAGDVRANVRVLICWAERFLFKLTERGGSARAAESTLAAFGGALTKRTKRPFQLAEVYVLQVPGQVANSERYVPREVLGREELPSGVVALWKGKTGTGTLFISVLEDARKAGYAFEKLRRASEGILTPGYEGGLFTGRLPVRGPISCFRRGRAVVGLVGAAESKEHMSVLDEVRKRCANQAGVPVLVPGRRKPR